jgi:hypothetical protein
LLETTGICIRIVRVGGRDVERCRIEEQIVEFSRRRRPVLAEHLGDVENLWRDREKTEPRRQKPSVVVRKRCNTIGEVVGSYAAPLGVLDVRLASPPASTPLLLGSLPVSTGRAAMRPG